jgi:hypothetical protein
VKPDVDYYHVLDVTRTATDAEIKAAYRLAAKGAHPDAGGTAKAMERVNEAYAVLSDPQHRREFDAKLTSARYDSAVSEHRPTVVHTRADPFRAPVTYQRSSHGHHPALIVLARMSALRMIGYNIVAGLLLGFVTSYMYALAPGQTAKTVIALVAFVPVYLVVIGIVFIIKPGLRLALAHLTALQWPAGRDPLVLLVMVACAIPLAFIWVIGFAAGILR